MPYTIQLDMFGGAELFKETDDGLVSMGRYLSESAANAAKGRLERQDSILRAVQSYEQRRLPLHERGKE